MAVDSATTIAALDATKPAGADQRAELDDAVRHFKGVVKSAFPAVAGAVTVSHTDLNSVTGRSLRAGDTYTGAHDFTGATPTVPTATPGTGSTAAASTAFVQAAIAAVNAQTGIVASFDPGASFSVTDGQIKAATNAGAVAVDMSSTWAVGAVRGVIFDAATGTSTINLGSYTVKGWNGATVTGTLTCDQPIPVVLRNFGDFLRIV